MKNYSRLILFALSVIWSCEKSDVVCCASPDLYEEFIFGTYYGECLGEGCIETFKLENGTLFEAQKDSYAGPSPYPGAWISLDDDQYQKVKDLPAAFPNALFEETETTIGMPDAGDWGGIYIEIESPKGDRFHWNIDTMEENLPEYLHEFAAAVQDAVRIINE